MSKSRKRKNRKDPRTYATGPSRAAYDSDLTFRVLLDEWVRERRCPLVLVDRCYELDLPNQADFARWAAAQPGRWCGHDEGGKEVNCGTYPCKHQKDYYFVTRDVNSSSAYGLPRPRMGRQVSYSTDRFDTPLEAILWVLDEWKAPKPRKPRAEKPRAKKAPVAKKVTVETKPVMKKKKQLPSLRKKT